MLRSKDAEVTRSTTTANDFWFLDYALMVGTMRLALILLLLVACNKDSVSSKETPPNKQSSKEGATTEVEFACKDDPASELITFESYGTHGLEFSERLVLRCNGGLEYRAWLPFSPQHMHRPGLYTGSLSEAELANAKKLASQLARPTATPSQPPQGVDTFVRIHVKDGPSLGHELRPDQNPADRSASSMLQAWMVRASTPKTAVELTLRAPEGASFHKGQAMLMVELKNLGEQDVSLNIDAWSAQMRINRQPVELKLPMEWSRRTGTLSEGLAFSLAPKEEVMAPLHFELEDAGQLETTAEFEGQLEVAGKQERVRWRSQAITMEAAP